MKISKLLHILTAAVVMLSSCDSKLDFSSFEDASSSFEFKDVPSSIDMEVGQTRTVVIKAKTTLAYKIKPSSGVPAVVEVSSVNDTTIHLRAKSIGTAKVTVAFSIWSAEITVNVGALTLADFSMDASDVVIASGETVFRPVALDPIDYPVGYLNVESESEEDHVVMATPYADTLSGTSGILFMGGNPGKAKVSVSGTRKNGTKKEYSINVRVKSTPVKSVYLRQASGTEVIEGIERIKYVKLDDGLSFSLDSEVQMGVIWAPENASVTDAALELSGVTLNLKTKDAGGRYTEGEIADLLNSGDVDMDGFSKRFGCTLLSLTDAARTVSLERDTSREAKDLFSYLLSSSEPCVVVLRAYVIYLEGDDYSGMERYIIVRLHD